MNLDATFYGRVDLQGRLLFPRDIRIRHDARIVSFTGKNVVVTVEEAKATRSLKQNAWIWGVAYPLIAETIGYDRHEHDELHYWLVATCFGTHFDERISAEVPNARSSKLTTKEFGDYMEWLVRFAAQKWSCVIPLPDEGTDDGAVERFTGHTTR